MVSIDNFRKMALSLAEVEELPHFEKTSFRVSKKIVATLDVKAKRVVLKLSEIEQSIFSAYDKTIIYPVNGAWGKQGWTIIELDKVKKEVLKDALQTSYNNVAPKTKIKKTISIKKATTSDSELVTEHIQKLSPVYREIIDALRTIILKTDKQIGEHIKWNSPAFYYTGEMKAFDAKEYKRNLVVANLSQKNHVLLVFPTGASINDTSGLLEGDYKDGRRMMKINDLQELKAKEKGLKTVIKEWIKLIDK